MHKFQVVLLQSLAPRSEILSFNPVFDDLHLLLQLSFLKGNTVTAVAHRSSVSEVEKADAEEVSAQNCRFQNKYSWFSR